MLRLTKINSAGGEFAVYVSRLHVEYIEEDAGELSVVHTSSGMLFVKETCEEILRMLKEP